MEPIATAVTLDDIAYVRRDFMEAQPVHGLPRASYQLPGGELYYARDRRRLADEAGSIEAVPAMFARRLAAAMLELDHRVDPDDEWQAYLAGLYGVCLYEVTPEAIVHKARLVARLDRMLAHPGDAAWLAALHADVDALDALARPFAACDRARFGRPTSRDRLITAVRAAWPGTLA
ncbi:MAG: DUF6058 family natural product biosynthesis protein [Kofleriaceae bacterium]